MSAKVAFICSSTSYGGLEINVVRLVGWLNQRGTSTCLLANPESPMGKEATGQSLEVAAIGPHRKYLDIAAGHRLANLLRQKEIGIMVVSATRDISVSTWAKRFYPELKLIYHQHMQIGVDKKDLFHTRRYRRLDAWIAPLKFLAAEVKQRTHYFADRIHLIPFCIDLSKIKTIERHLARQQLNLPPEGFVIGILGRLDQHKGQLFVTQCLPKLVTAGHNVHLLLVGEPTRDEGDDFMKILNKEIADHQLEERIHLRGFLHDTNLFFSGIDIFAMASNKETYGMVTIEAMAAGVPVIGTNAGGTPEILEDGRLGTLYNPHNHQEFVTKLSALIEDFSHAQAKAELAQQLARQTYGHENECRLVEELFTKILGA